MNTEDVGLEEGMRQWALQRLRLLELAKARVKSLTIQLASAKGLVTELSTACAKPAAKRLVNEDKPHSHHYVTKPDMEEMVDSVLNQHPNSTAQEAWKLVNAQLLKDGYQPQGAKRIFNLVFESKSCILDF